MTQINPLTGAILQSTQVQRQQAAQRDRQVRREHLLAKDVAMQGDQLEHQVESSEEIRAIHEERDNANLPRKRPPRQHKPFSQNDDAGDEPHLDVTA